MLITCDHYFYNGKKINILDKVDEILKQIPSIKTVIAYNYNNIVLLMCVIQTVFFRLKLYVHADKLLL